MLYFWLMDYWRFKSLNHDYWRFWIMITLTSARFLKTWWHHIRAEFSKIQWHQTYDDITYTKILMTSFLTKIADITCQWWHHFQGFHFKVKSEFLCTILHKYWIRTDIYLQDSGSNFKHFKRCEDRSNFCKNSFSLTSWPSLLIRSCSGV